jgi:hypothetical protein
VPLNKGFDSADKCPVAALLRLIGLGASLVVLISFLAFASDQTTVSRDAQVAKVDGVRQAAPSTDAERARERRHGDVREAIDDANDFLVKPFADVVGSDSLWAQRIVSGLLALLTYGLGLFLLANFVRPRRPRPGGSFSEPSAVEYRPYR